MTNQVNPIPENYHTLIPTLVVANVEQAVEFYQRAFGAEVLRVISNLDGKTVNATLKIGDSVLVLHHQSSQMNYLEPQPGCSVSSYLCIYVENVDATFNQAVAAGAKVLMPVDNKYWGERYGKVLDPFGHEWALATQISHLTSKEILGNYAEMIAMKNSNAPA